MSAFQLSTLFTVLVSISPLRAQPPAVAVAAQPAPAQVVAQANVVVLQPPVRFVVYPWVATVPWSTHWWQYPWYAAPWWGSPWWTYWYLPNVNVYPGGYWYAPGYYATPTGYWHLPPQYNYWHYWRAPVAHPAYNPYWIRTASATSDKPIGAEHTAESLYDEGLSAYWNGHATEARRLLTAAAQRDADDARAWYFKALAERQLGDEAAARDSARRGAMAEARRGDRAQVSLALERIQGEARRFLRANGTESVAGRLR